ncbi:unnamed protein product [Pieris brassicae]|uniref:Uncharacterized protein n=1 Tax=Pieris brassicae TaxID=7116 RepID=A0A9P0THC8_PIEBR|nr:unnamed protein product [Pieris brassicae]
MSRRELLRALTVRFTPLLHIDWPCHTNLSFNFGPTISRVVLIDFNPGRSLKLNGIYSAYIKRCAHNAAVK